MVPLCKSVPCSSCFCSLWGVFGNNNISFYLKLYNTVIYIKKWGHFDNRESNTKVVSRVSWWEDSDVALLCKVPLANLAWGTRNRNRQENHLGTVLHVANLASVGRQSVVRCCVWSHLVPLGPTKFPPIWLFEQEANRNSFMQTLRFTLRERWWWYLTKCKAGLIIDTECKSWDAHMDVILTSGKDVNLCSNKAV